MHVRSSGSASAGVRDRLRLEWEIGLQRLPFFTQRLAVALLGLLVVSLALVGGMAILQGGQQGSDVQLRPQPEAGQPSASTGPELLTPPAPVQGVAGGGGTGQGGGERTSVPVGARSPSSSAGQAGSGAGPGPTTRPAPGGAGQQAPPTTTAPPTSTPTSDEPTTTDGGILGPLPPVLSTLLN